MALPITLYGATDCDDTAATKAHLNERAISYREINIDHDPEAERFVLFINDGSRTTPTLVFGEGKLKIILIEPTTVELDELLPPRSNA